LRGGGYDVKKKVDDNFFIWGFLSRGVIEGNRKEEDSP